MKLFRPEENVKIASDTPGRDLKRQTEQPEFFSAALRQHASGKTKAARDFGARLARRLSAADHRLLPKDDDPEARRLRELFAFCVAAGLELYAGDNFVFRAALNGFYDELRALDRNLYDELDDGAFSFYYLDFRKGKNVPEGIGARFAMLAGAPEDPALRERGKRMYRTYLRFVRLEMQKAGLAESSTQ